MAIDVEALYNLIPHYLGVGVAEGFIFKRDLTSGQYNKFILDLLCFILTNNIFHFGHSYYLQVPGVAMGTKCAPTYVNLYLGE